LGIIIASLGLLLSWIWVKDTSNFLQQETQSSQIVPLQHVFWDTTWRHKTLGSITQAGLVNNLNDGMIWGLLPILLLTAEFNQTEIGIIAAIYPSVWGLGQLFTGKMSDVYSKKKMLFWGMLLQGFAIMCLPLLKSFFALAFLSALLGIGTALVYPTFLSSIAQTTNPNQRAESIGAFRWWRDLGYAFGAIISGVIADAFGIDYAIWLIGLLTIASSLVIALRMEEIDSNEMP
jgi:MFS family permease